MSEPYLILPEEAAQDVEVSPAHKLAHDRLYRQLAGAAMGRQEHCWMREARGCQGTPILHVQEVGLDMREQGARSRVALLSSKDLKGPVPGFCVGCMATAPAMLAEAVYSMRRETQFGVKPRRWFIRFTDGTSQVGECKEFALASAKFTYSDRPTS